MSLEDIDLIVGGPQGGGIDSAAQVIIRSFSIAGYRAYGVREYHSNIKGRHSYFHVRIRDGPVNSVKYPVDLLVCLDSETPFVHMDDVTNGSIVLYDGDLGGTKIEQVLTLEPETKIHVIDKLKRGNFDTTVNGAMEYMKSKGAIPFPTSFREIVVNSLGTSKPPARYANTIGVSVVLALAGLPIEYAVSGLGSVFGKKKQVLEDNEKVVREGYEFAMRHYGKEPHKLEFHNSKDKYVITGNEAVAIGKVIGGLRMQSYYPITPAADESFFLEGHDHFEEDGGSDMNAEGKTLQKSGVVIIQAEDEISAIAMAISSAMTGARSATGTSGPGFSLMAEGIGYAGINEVPVVITLYQRGGPSTGMPTRNSQADLLFAINTGHGEFVRIVYSSGDVNEAIADSARVFNYAEQFQVPVIHILDKNFANSFYVIDGVDYSKIKIKRWKVAEGDNVERFKITEDGVSPMAFLGKNIMWLTGDEHTELGHITEDPTTRDLMFSKRMKKAELIKKMIPEEEQVQLIGDEDPDVTILTWGSNKGVVLDALDTLRKQGIKGNLLYVRLMEPFPAELVSRYLSKAKVVIDLENNYLGQLASLVKQHCGVNLENFILKYNGRHPTEDEVSLSIKRILNNNEKRVVMTSGA